MSKILLIVAAVLLLGSTGLSFANKSKLAAAQDDAKTAHQSAQTAQAEASKNKNALTKAQTDAKDAVQKATDAQGELASVKGQVSDLSSQLQTAKADAAAKEAQIKDVNDKLTLLTSSMPKTTGDNDPVKQVENLKRENEELQVVKNGLDSQVKSLQGQVATAARTEQQRQSGVLMQGLQGRVLAVDRNWNFVVLNLGDQKGVINGANMIVQRNGSLVGKVKITSVEPSQSIADIVPNSVPPGVSVQAGDTVVFPGS